MKVEVKDGNLIVTMPMGTPTPSKSGKTMVICSTHGCKVTDTLVDGKPVTIGLNAYIKR